MADAWYWADWRPNDGEMRGAREGQGLELELIDGPLRGRSVMSRDTLIGMWVAQLDGQLLVLERKEAEQRPRDLPRGAVLLGFYVYDSFQEALIFVPI